MNSVPAAAVFLVLWKMPFLQVYFSSKWNTCKRIAREAWPRLFCINRVLHNWWRLVGSATSSSESNDNADGQVFSANKLKCDGKHDIYACMFLTWDSSSWSETCSSLRRFQEVRAPLGTDGSRSWLILALLLIRSTCYVNPDMMALKALLVVKMVRRTS